MQAPPDIVSTSDEGQGAFGKLATLEGHLQVEDGRISTAVNALTLLVLRGCHVHKGLYYRVLKRCIADKSLVLGRRIHALTIKSGYGGDAFLGTQLIGLYASHGRLEEAMRVFTNVSKPNAYNWATIIFAHARHGKAAQAVQLYRQLRETTTIEPTHHIYVAVVKACAAARDSVAGKEVHAHILVRPGESDIFVQTALVDMYAKCGSLDDARSLFDKLPQRDVVSWNAMITGYAQQGKGQEALRLHKSMQQQGMSPPNSVTYVCLLQACATVGGGALHQGKQLHAQIEQQGRQDEVVLGGSLVNMYAKCGSLKDARSVFDRLRVRNVVAWNAMLAGYAQRGMGQETLSLYHRMQQESVGRPDSVTILCLLQACASIGIAALPLGRQIHAQIEKLVFEADVVLGTCLIDMYAKCGSLERARIVFDRLPGRTVVTWNVMLAGYTKQGMGEEALSFYSSMQREGITPPDAITFACLLQACAIVAALTVGKQLHRQIMEQGLQARPVVGTALVNMYAKCGSMFDSQRVFDSLPERSLEAWGALTCGYTRQGDSEVVFELFDRMRQDGLHPDGVTFLGVLTVCSHVGLVETGRKYFNAMWTEYGISPTVEHYTCVMDLLGRAGHLEEALQMAKVMPFPPDGAVWLTLLGACRKWKNVDIGQQAFEFAVSVDAKDPASYVLMCNIYASAEMWEEANEMRARRLKCGAWKKPGQSWWTDMSGVVHTFAVGDKKHPDGEGIYARLEQEEGYIPLPDEDKGDVLSSHRA